MTSGSVRLTLLILFLVASTATGYFIWTSDAGARSAAEAARRFDDDAAAAAARVLELRASQQAYVAEGQGEGFWISRVGTLMSDLQASTSAVRTRATTPRAQTALGTAAELLKDFEQMDKRAREYARNGQRLIASDLIFSDGLELTGGMLSAIADARSAERAARARSAWEARLSEFLMLGAYAASALLAIALLVPLKKARPEPAEAAGAPLDVPREPGAFELDPLSFVDGPRGAFDAGPHRTSQPISAQGTVDLDAVASLCAELARVIDTRSLPSMLERAASVLDAAGVVLWIADPDGRELTPAAAHGYSPQLLSRLGAIARDAENVTAAAFRTGLVQTLNADAVSNGAIAAPLVTSTGTVGVMAAEVRNDGEQQPAKLAAAAIVAAQLATLVGPPSVQLEPASEAAGV